MSNHLLADLTRLRFSKKGGRRMDVSDVVRLLDLVKLKDNIIQTSIVAWKYHITPSSLEKWLDNFTGAALGDKVAEQTIAAWLLTNFTYYTEAEVRELCRLIYRKYIHRKLQEDYYQKSSNPIQTKIQRILKRSFFVPLGNPSESGALILFNFRTANALPKEIFEQPTNWKEKLADGTIDDVVLIDDVTLSGSQAIQYVQSLPLAGVQTTLMTFFATPLAINNLKYHVPFLNLMPVNLLDARTNLFSNDSFVFSNEDCLQLKDLAYTLCLYYGQKIVDSELPFAESYMKKYPLGFANGQHLFGFYYNTPDNTLPIFWCESSNWNPAFVRYAKVYGTEGVEIQNEQYW